jgi:hypothetical protein
MKKIKDTYRILTTPLPPKEAKQFHEQVAKPLIGTAFAFCFIVIVLDYTFQLIEAIDLITL